jgi:hypothetical protein
MPHSRGLPDAPTTRTHNSGDRQATEPLRLLMATTEITVVGGGRYVVDGDARDIERTILDAARGSLMELAWLVEAETGARIGVNPECVVMLRVASS